MARSKWLSSGLSDSAAKKLGFRHLSAQAVAKLSDRFYKAGALYLPYLDLDGKFTKFYRIRYLENLPGMAGQAAKPQKYDQLPVMQEVYYPPLMKQTWRAIASDPSISIAITEGELKAAAGTCSQVAPTMGLGGVYSFMSQKRGIDLLPSMREFEWEGRQVTVIYDNDLYDNPAVMRAQRLLADRLTAEGARVFFAALPRGPHKGLDDLLVARGKAAYEMVLAKAIPHGEGSALWRLNEEIVYIRPPTNVVVEKESNLLIRPDVFERTAYANRFYMAEVERGSGRNKHVVLEKTKLAPRWLEWESRAELFGVTYDPGQPKIFEGRWNTWSDWGVRPRRGDVAPWKWLMDFLFGRDLETRKYFERWCAYPLQHPGAKLYTAVVLWSRVKRLGKSMALLALAKIYGDNAVFVNSKQLKGSFNTWAKDRQLVVGEEITAGEARVDADFMKDIITNPFFTINTKFMPEYVIPNRTNYAFLSNHPDAVFLEDGDKRYLIHAVPRSDPAPRSKYEWCDRWLHGDGPSYLFDYFLRMDLSRFNPREHAPDTMSKYQMIVAGKTDVGLWVLRLQEDPKSALRPLGQKASEECDLYTAEQMHRAFDPEGRWTGRGVLASLGKALVSAGFRHVNGGDAMQTGDGKIHRLFAIRNAMKWEQATRSELRDHYDTYFGPAKAGEVK